MAPAWRKGAVVLPLVLVTLLGGCRGEGSRPSILLFVFDTTRFDAVSGTPSTTPTLDALAARGVRYTRAYAQANWTVPSHASLFTGLYPHAHGVFGLRTRLPDEIATLAERLRAAGWDTAAISENPWINEQNGLARGFTKSEVLYPKPENGGAETIGALTTWLAQRKRDRPFFLFVNVMDAHWQYPVRAENPYLPAGVDRVAAAAVSQVPRHYLCVSEPRDHELAVLKGLYLGGVAAADRKLAVVLEKLRQADVGNLITIATSDHGEHFGEHRLLLHNYAVYEELIHVPLVVHGAGGAAMVDDAVQLTDVVPSVLAWTGLPPADGLAGRPLPLRAGSSGAPRPVFSEYTELEGREELIVPPAVEHLNIRRDSCRPEDRLFGDMQALILWPLKLVRYVDGPPALYDLSRDPHEADDGAARSPDLVAALLPRLNALASSSPTRPAPAEWAPDPALTERLRALGYVNGH